MKHFISVMLFIFISSFLLGNFEFTSKAEESRREVYYTYTKVQYGDTLESISDEYNNGTVDNEEYVNEIIRINSLTDSRLHPGAYITVMYYK